MKKKVDRIRLIVDNMRSSEENEGKEGKEHEDNTDYTATTKPPGRHSKSPPERLDVCRQGSKRYNAEEGGEQ